MLLASLWAKNTQRGQQTFELQWSESTSVSDPIVHHDSYDHYSKGRQFLTSFICSFREMIAVSAGFPPDLTRRHQLPSTLLQKSFYGFLENSVKLRWKRRFLLQRYFVLAVNLRFSIDILLSWVLITFLRILDANWEKLPRATKHDVSIEWFAPLS